MKSTVTFKEYFQMYIEDMTAGGAMGGSTGGFNPAAGNINSTDSYATGDARLATSSKTIQKRSGSIKMKIKRKRKK